ncbi:MAG TPA: thiamine diphosphokinase [Limnochordia bacterium]
MLLGGDLLAWPYAGRGWVRIVCADSGADHALALGLRPDLIIGDLDSIAPRARAAFRDVPTRTMSHDKDATDGELAVMAALATQAASIVIAGALGGRFDHALANVGLLIAVAAAGRQGIATDGRQFVFHLSGPGRWELSGHAGDLFSVIPAGADGLVGLSLSGARWPLSGATLPAGTSRGVSNEFAAARVQITLERGTGWLIATPQESGPPRPIHLQAAPGAAGLETGRRPDP